MTFGRILANWIKIPNILEACARLDKTLSDEKEALNKLYEETLHQQKRAHENKECADDWVTSRDKILEMIDICEGSRKSLQKSAGDVTYLYGLLEPRATRLVAEIDTLESLLSKRSGYMDTLAKLIQKL
ncbi:hypothetical protein SLS53_004743 [Cytospora paraplurivora]|uniref:Uncharacterized protein n=1 Tax=Cytospora paraplurivora TaxID=2898453 RepID=A0AAN9U885_9PEZI